MVNYLEMIRFPNEDAEFEFFIELKSKAYNNFYPFQVLSKRRFERIDFEPVTILYGGNGSGKTTALNVIAEMIQADRTANYNKSSFFDTYLNDCSLETSTETPLFKKIITSDDVFEEVLALRDWNDQIDIRREELMEGYLEAKYSDFRYRSLNDYEELKKVTKARRMTQSRFAREEGRKNERSFSNGESAFRYFVREIEENGLYLLDEPENSLSPERQLELMQYIEDSARYFNCQFVISTHSPFLLSMKGAKIYDLDADPVTVSEWTNLKNVRIYQQFFELHKEEFKNT